MTDLLWLLLALACCVALLFWQIRRTGAVLALGALLLLWSVTAADGWVDTIVAWLLYGAAVILVGYGGLRRWWLTAPALRWFRRTLPELSAAERIALNAGTVSWEAELFSGVPDWQQLQRLPQPRLSDAEQEFMAGPLQNLLQRMAAASHADNQPQPLDNCMWQQLADDGFFGLAIPAEHGGRGLSARARSDILAAVAAAPGGATLGPIIATANGLGPAQLLLACGTDDQKSRHLPRLARGDDLPCFALTSDWAGTDVAAVTDSGVICRYSQDGESRLGLRLNWRKRHVTLAPLATLIGLAVQVHDPERLLGGDVQLGLTCLLVAAATPGVEPGQYQRPIGAAFPYGTTVGHDVLVPLDAVIGGRSMIGQGWQLLMEQLPVSRAVAVPSAAAGLCASQARLAGAYARVRRQFGRPIGAFEGIEEVLARMAGHAYACEAVRRLVANAVDLGERPAIAAAIAKYHCSTRSQQVVVDSMTLLAGKAASIGPGNPVAVDYMAAPLAATADGTNIFTRSMLILGQGGIRCHPFLQAEITAAERPDAQRALAAFDAVLPHHMGHLLTVTARAFVLGLRGSGGAGSHSWHAVTRRYRRRITRYAAALALVSDLTMAVAGANLRHRENMSGRLGDVLSQLYIASAVLQRWEHDGAHRTDLNLVEWVCEDCFASIEQQLARTLRHLHKRPLAWLARALIFPWGRHADGPGDDCNHRVATILQTPGDTRDRLTPHCCNHPEPARGVALFDAAMQAAADTAALRKRLRRAIRRGDLHGTTPHDSIDEARALGLLDAAEEQALRAAQALHDAVIQVDAFAAD